MGGVSRSRDRLVGVPLSGPLDVLIASIVDPATARNGAATVTRGWIAALVDGPLRARVTCVALPGLSPARHRVRQLGAIGRGLLSPLPAKVAFTRRRALRRALEAALRERPRDLLLVNGSDLLWLLPLVPRSLPCALIAHNVEHRLFADQARAVARRRPWLAPFLERERRRLEEFETAAVRAVRHVAVLSEGDRDWVRRIAPHTIVVPPLFPDRERHRCRSPGEDARPRRIGFVGNLDWWPNRDGLHWLLTRVWPHVDVGRVELHLFGKGTERAAPQQTRVVAHGEVGDIAAVLDGCDAMVCPAFAGGGVSVKLAEAVHHGVPAIASSFAADGLGLAPGPCLAVADDPAAWVRWLSGLPAVADCATTGASADRFAIETHAPAVAEFVLRAASDGAGAARSTPSSTGALPPGQAVKLYLTQRSASPSMVEAGAGPPRLKRRKPPRGRRLSSMGRRRSELRTR